MDTDVFLGVWECESPSAQLEIIEASPQAGGYAMTLFIRGSEMAHAYANPDGDTLVVNRGTIMGSYDFGGTVERTAEGIRFTVTESEFGPVRPGTSWDLVSAAVG